MEPTKAPEFPRPQQGDLLIVRTPKTRFRDEETTQVRVRAMARFRVTLEGVDGEKLPWMIEEFDIRTRAPWAVSGTCAYRLHTAETLKWADRKDAADRYLRESGVHLFNLRGSFKQAVNADPVGFVNALRRFEGLEDI